MNLAKTLAVVALLSSESLWAGSVDPGQTVCDAERPCSLPGQSNENATLKPVEGKTSPTSKESAVRKGPHIPAIPTTNIPSYFSTSNWSGFVASDHALQSKTARPARVFDLKAGDIVHAVIEHEVEVWPGVEAPVRAIVTKGKYRGAYLLGEARLDPSRKRALIDFSRVRPMLGAGDFSIQIKGVATGVDGKLGLDGEYHSETGKFMFAQVLASAASGFTDATIQRQQNSAGNWVQEPSLETAAKAGVATAVAKRADRWAQQEAAAPEWTEIGPYREVRVVLKQDAEEVVQ